MYCIIESEEFKKVIKKLLKRNKFMIDTIYKKVAEIVENPYHYKPLRAPKQGYRRVHILGCFVLTYSIDEGRKAVVLEDFTHHDEAYH